MGNSAQRIGYGCMLPTMVDLWRKSWSKVPGTTDPLAPFGVVSLASGGSEGGPDIGGMRFSQTANYGTLPSPDMPNSFLVRQLPHAPPPSVSISLPLHPPLFSFGVMCCCTVLCTWSRAAWAGGLGAPDRAPPFTLCVAKHPRQAHAFDLGDPWTSQTCVQWGCCYQNANATKCAASTKGDPSKCTAQCQGLLNTSFYMGPIHPRIKKPVGNRLAQAAKNLVCVVRCALCVARCVLRVMCCVLCVACSVLCVVCSVLCVVCCVFCVLCSVLSVVCVVCCVFCVVSCVLCVVKCVLCVVC